MGEDSLQAGTAIFIAAILATAGWIGTIRSQHRNERRRHTYQIVLGYIDKEKLLNGISTIKKNVKDNNIPSPQDEDRAEDISHLLYVLNHFEFLAVAIYCGDIDEATIKGCEETRIIKIFQTLNAFIDECRRHYQQPSMFISLENLVHRWTDKYPTNRAGLAEVILQRPCLKLQRTRASRIS